MRLTGKMSTVLALLVLAIFLVFYAVFRFVFLEGFAELDRREARNHMSRCLHALERERTLIGQFTRDWAAWDDMYRFAQDSNRDFRRSNLLWELFRDQEINLLQIYGNRGELVWGKAYDLKTGEEIPLDLSEELGKETCALLVRQHGPDASSRGYVRTSYGPMLVSSHPILTSEVRGPSRGVLVAGRLLTPEFLARISELAQVRLSGHPVDRAPEDLNPAGSPWDMVLGEEDGENISISSLLRDLTGNPVMLLTASVPRENIRVGTKVYNYGIVIILCSGVAVLIVVGGFFQYLVLKPVSMLTEQVLSARKGQPAANWRLSARRDEIGILSREFDHTMERLLEREQGLWLSERRLRQIIDHVPVLIFAKDEEGRYILANRMFADALGLPVQEIIGRNERDIPILRDHAERYCREDRETVTSGAPMVVAEDLLVDGAGMTRIFHTTKVPFTFSGTSTPSVLCSSVDITEMKKARDLLKQQGAIIEQSLDGILVADLDGLVRYANPAWMSMHGYTGEELSGRYLSFFHSEEQYSLDFMPFYEELLARGSCRCRMGRMRKGGEVFMTLTSAFILKDRSGAPDAIVSLARDISEEVRMEARVSQMQKMEVVGRLAGGVAHDLNNMLTPVLGYAEMVLLDLGKGDRHYESIRQIMTAADRAQDLTRQLLAFGRRQVLDMKALNLCEVVRSFRPMIRRTIREDIEIRIIGDDPAATALVDAGQIGQIIMNLVINAQDAMPNGGTIAIETSVVIHADGAEQISQGMRPGEYVLLLFSDTGTGMSKEVLDHIFEPFFTTKRQGKGTGLGLASVYGIVTQHEGFISVSSRPDEGSIFRIFLPRVQGPAEKVAGEIHPGRGRTGTETVIVAEDDDEVRNLVCGILKQHGYQVLTAPTPSECIQDAARAQGPVHLLLTDVIMPGMNGRQLFEALKHTRPAMKVLYMSGYTGDVIAHHGVLEDGVHFIQKPFSVQTLTEKVRAVLDEEPRA